MSDKANRFRFRAWVKRDIDCSKAPLVAGWLTPQCLWWQLDSMYVEVNWGVDEEPLEPLGLGDLALEQSTGILDANGVEVFEGDVLEAIWVREPECDPDLTVVRWEGCEFYLYDVIDDMPAPCHIVDCVRLTVRGNIHENPELLGVN